MGEIIDWPSFAIPRSAMFHPDVPSRSGGLSLNGFEQVTVSSAGRWRAVLDVPLLTENAVLSWRAFLAQMMGRVGTVRVPKWEKYGPTDRNGRRFDDLEAVGYEGDTLNWDLTGFGQSENPVAVLAAQANRGATQIVVSLDYVEGPRPGQYFGIGGRLHLVQTASHDENTGLMTVRFWPPLRVSAPIYTPVVLDRPTCLMRFASDTAGELNLEYGRWGSASVELVEAPPETTEVNPPVVGGLLFPPPWVPYGATLALNFDENRYYAKGVSGSPLTLSRASSGTYFDADGVMQIASNNQIRLDHEPVSREPLGVLVEEQRTNLLLQSDNLADAGWTKTRCSVIDAGTTRGMKLWRMVPNTDAATSHQLSRNATFPALASDTTYSVSLVAKAGSGDATRIALRFADTVGFLIYVYVDLITGTIVSGGAITSTITRAVVVPLGDGFYRIEISYVVRATSTYATVQVYASSPGAVAVTSHTFNGTDGYLLSCPQIEQALFPTSYIPTVGSTVTRAADLITVSPSGQWWLGTAGGTVISEQSVRRSASEYVTVNDRAGIWGADLNSVAGENLIEAYYPNTLQILSRSDGGDFVARTLSAGMPAPNVRRRLGVAFDGVTSSVSWDGIAATSGPNGVNLLRPLVAFHVARTVVGGSTRVFNGHLRTLAFFPRVMPSDELQAKTVLT